MSEKKKTDEEKKVIGSFTESEFPRYESNYSDAVKQSLSDILNRKEYSYNAENDQLFSKYKTMYTENGRRAMQDTMGNAALLTGGYGNTYGTVAGQQAYNSYMQALNEKSAELEQKAYERYRDDENRAYERLNTLLGLEGRDYDRYRDAVGDHNADRQFLYKLEQDRLAQENLEYERYRDAYESDRKYELDLKKLNASLQNAVDNEQGNTNDGKFDPEEAYKFIEKNNRLIYTDEEFAETLYQLYGERKGFFNWLKTLEVPGNTDGETYLEILYYLHPELQIPYEHTYDDWEYGAITGGAVPPADARDRAKREGKQ